jgi:hypothetical protein
VRCPAPVWVRAAHGPFVFVLFLTPVCVPEHVHVHLHGRSERPEAEAVPGSEGWVGSHYLGLDLLLGKM